MEEYIFQRGLPAQLVDKATKRKDGFIHYYWRFETAIEVLNWIKHRKYIVLFIGAITIIDEKFSSTGLTWNYQGDRTKSRVENNEDNYFKALQFVTAIPTEKKADLLFDILFESEENMDEIEKAFFDRAKIHRGEIAFKSSDALDLIETCKEFGKRIIGLDSFKIFDPYIQPMDYIDYSGKGYETFDPKKYFEIFHINKNSDDGHWGEARQFVIDRADKDWYFEIDYED